MIKLGDGDTCWFVSGSLLHAECEVEWKLPISCDLVRSGLVDMMGEWAGDDTTGQVW